MAGSRFPRDMAWNPSADGPGWDESRMDVDNMHGLERDRRRSSDQPRHGQFQHQHAGGPGYGQVQNFDGGPYQNRFSNPRTYPQNGPQSGQRTYPRSPPRSSYPRGPAYARGAQSGPPELFHQPRPHPPLPPTFNKQPSVPWRQQQQQYQPPPPPPSQPPPPPDDSNQFPAHPHSHPHPPSHLSHSASSSSGRTHAPPAPEAPPSLEPPPLFAPPDGAQSFAPPAQQPMLPEGFSRPQWQRQRLHLDEDVFERITQVGEGTYGKVFKARDRITNDLVALKKIRMETEREGFPFTALREIKLLMQLRHPNIIGVREIMSVAVTEDKTGLKDGTRETKWADKDRSSSWFLVFDYLDHDLAGLISHVGVRFQESQLKCLVQQLLRGLEFLHSRNILHRDIKGSNLLLNSRGELKLADFGLARDLSRRRDVAATGKENGEEDEGIGREGDYTNRVITLWYRPPELLWGATKYGEEVDMWSAGCIILELYMRCAAFQGTDEISQLRAIWKILGTPSAEDRALLGNLQWFHLAEPREDYVRSLDDLANTHHIPPLALDLVSQLLSYNPTTRPSASKALTHPWFSTHPLPCPEGNHIPIDIEGDWHEYEAKQRKRARRGEGQTKQDEDAGKATATAVAEASAVPANASLSLLNIQPPAEIQIVEAVQGVLPEISGSMPSVTRNPPSPAYPVAEAQVPKLLAATDGRETVRLDQLEQTGRDAHGSVETHLERRSITTTVPPVAVDQTRNLHETLPTQNPSTGTEDFSFPGAVESQLRALHFRRREHERPRAFTAAAAPTKSTARSRSRSVEASRKPRRHRSSSRPRDRRRSKSSERARGRERVRDLEESDREKGQERRGELRKGDPDRSRDRGRSDSRTRIEKRPRSGSQPSVERSPRVQKASEGAPVSRDLQSSSGQHSSSMREAEGQGDGRPSTPEALEKLAMDRKALPEASSSSKPAQNLTDEFKRDTQKHQALGDKASPQRSKPILFAPLVSSKVGSPHVRGRPLNSSSTLTIVGAAAKMAASKAARVTGGAKDPDSTWTELKEPKFFSTVALPAATAGPAGSTVPTGKGTLSAAGPASNVVPKVPPSRSQTEIMPSRSQTAILEPKNGDVSVRRDVQQRKFQEPGNKPLSTATLGTASSKDPPPTKASPTKAVRPVRRGEAMGSMSQGESGKLQIGKGTESDVQLDPVIVSALEPAKLKAPDMPKDEIVSDAPASVDARNLNMPAAPPPSQGPFLSASADPTASFHRESAVLRSSGSTEEHREAGAVGKRNRDLNAAAVSDEPPAKKMKADSTFHSHAQERLEKEIMEPVSTLPSPQIPPASVVPENLPPTEKDTEMDTQVKTERIPTDIDMPEAPDRNGNMAIISSEAPSLHGAEREAIPAEASDSYDGGLKSGNGVPLPGKFEPSMAASDADSSKTAGGTVVSSVAGVPRKELGGLRVEVEGTGMTEQPLPAVEPIAPLPATPFEADFGGVNGRDLAFHGVTDATQLEAVLYTVPTVGPGGSSSASDTPADGLTQGIGLPLEPSSTASTAMNTAPTAPAPVTNSTHSLANSIRKVHSMTRILNLYVRPRP